MRRVRRIWLLLGAVALGISGCSGGADDSIATPFAPPSCKLLARLATTADTLERADLADPSRFERALEAAVAEYVATVKELRAVTPASLHDDLDQLQAAVEQHRFQDAVAARTALDSYATSTCGRSATTATSSG